MNLFGDKSVCRIYMSFFYAVTRSKLASLFGLEGAMDSGGNESLTYKAPTEPKKRASSGLYIVFFTAFYNEYLSV